MELLKVFVQIIFLVLLVAHHNVDAVCTLPTDMQNGVWTSSNFGIITTGTTYFNFTKTINLNEMAGWTCHVNTSTQFVIKSVETFTAFTDSTVNYYYCLNFTQQNTHSFSYSILGDKNSVLADERVKQFPDTLTITTTEACAVTTALDTALYDVMINSASPSSANQYCSTPLLGTFMYQFADDSGTNQCGATPGTGSVDVCNNADKDKLTFDYTACTQQVADSASGIANCVATETATSGTVTTYYQTLYVTATSAFVCFVITSTESNGVTTVYISQKSTNCEDGQTSTTAPTGGATLVLTANATCPFTTTSESSSSNTLMIVLIVLGLLILILIVAGLLFYFCYWKKRDPNAGKPIVENTKPRFEDPDKEDVLEDLDLEDARSTPLTRDDIAFEAGSPNFMLNSKPDALLNGHATRLSPNGNLYHGNPGMHNGGLPNGGSRRDSGIALTELSGERPMPRIGINSGKEAMVIFNGDEKVISGNDSRIVPIDNPKPQTMTMNNMNTSGGPLTLMGLDFTDNYEDDELGELSSHVREKAPYPSLPREKSNLMPPIETTDPENNKSSS